MPSPENARAVVVGLACAAAAFFVFGGASSGEKLEPLDAVPRGAFLVATVDAAELRRSPVSEALLGRETHRALGLGSLAEACGFDPLARVQRLAIAVPEDDSEPGEFGLAARVEVSRDELRRCTEEIAHRRGTSAEIREVGRFFVVETAARGARPRLAYGAGGLLVVGKGAWFDAMLAAAQRAGPGLDASSAHAALRRSLSSREGWRSPTALVTAVLPRSLRDRIRAEMGAELGGDRSSATMAGVLGVGAVGLAVRTAGPGGRVEARAELICDAPAECQEVEKLVLRKRLEWSKDLSLRLVGLGALADALEVTREGDRVHATASVGAEALAATIDRLVRLRARRQEAPPPPAVRGGGPDETIPAAPDAGGPSARDAGSSSAEDAAAPR